MIEETKADGGAAAVETAKAGLDRASEFLTGDAGDLARFVVKLQGEAVGLREQNEKLRKIIDGHLRARLKLEESSIEMRRIVVSISEAAISTNGATTYCRLCGTGVRDDDPEPANHRGRCSFRGDIRETKKKARAL